ncbi:MAG TPA: hypothetical protein VKK79_02790 [Candidatus Lokiarchaeia archaeon]|nr:hypothetical protein [Candidatus Lokiarchaeia archaeon]
MQPVKDNPNWNIKVRALGEKFNQYVQRHSARLVSDLIEQLLRELDNPDPILRFDVASLLREIRDNNPGVIVYEYSQKIDKVLWGREKKESVPSAPPAAGTYEDYTGDSSTPAKLASQVNPQAGSRPAGEQSIGYWTEEELASTQQQDEQQNEPANLLEFPVERLNLKNVHKVSMKADYAKRKCAMGDGEFEDYTEDLWECKCGTLYHPECLKVQAIFTGTCAICERPFREPTPNK